jgi:Family of unknown function (DUF6455)
MTAPATRERPPIYEMLDRLGVERGGGVVPRLSLSYATAFRRCESCLYKQACRAWLDGSRGPALFAPDYCPNADIFFELQINQPGHDRPAAFEA